MERKIVVGKLKEKVYDWKNRLQDRHMLTLVISLIAVIVILGLYTYKKQIQYPPHCVYPSNQK